MSAQNQEVQGAVIGTRKLGGAEMEFGTAVMGEPVCEGAAKDSMTVLFDGERDDQGGMGELVHGITIVYAGALEEGQLVLQVLGRDVSQLHSFALDIAAQFVKKNPKLRSWSGTGVAVKNAVPCFDPKFPEFGIGSKEYAAIPADQRSKGAMAAMLIEFSGYRR